MRFRPKIIVGMLCVVAISGGSSALIGGYLLWRNLGQEAEQRVQKELDTALDFYDQRLQAISAALQYTVLGERFCQAVANKDISYLSPRLDLVRKNAELDILYVTDSDGRVIHRAQHPTISGDSVANDPLVNTILSGANIVSGTTLFPVQSLETENPELAQQARISVLPAATSATSAKAELDSAIVLGAAAAVYGPRGELVGILRAGSLSTQNYELVDRIERTVFRFEQYRGRPVGAASIFQQEVRVSTSVRNPDGSRAIGTRIDADIYNSVVENQKAWLGKVCVTDDWYVAAYAPILDLDRRPIGMLGVGVLQGKFTDIALSTVTTFVIITSACLLAGALLAWKLANSVSRPVHALAGASEKIARGEFSETVQIHSSDEIGALAQTFNAMAHSLKERDELLRQRTRIQLTRSERLAAVGRLAAGIAHEINNPLTGVLTFSHMLLKDAPEGSQLKEDVQTIISATTRCRDIVRGLLNFARQTEPQKTLADLNKVLQEALNLTKNQALINKITVVAQMDQHLPDLVIDPHQIEEVVVNILLNAIDAMPDGGKLTVSSGCYKVEESRWVEVSISDTGCGMSHENLEHIFEPFFTTKPVGKGTGLGLAISYGIVSEHGGEINVSSQLNLGTTVTIRLPISTKEHGNGKKSTDLSSG